MLTYLMKRMCFLSHCCQGSSWALKEEVAQLQAAARGARRATGLCIFGPVVVGSFFKKVFM